MPIESCFRESDSPFVSRVWKGRVAGETSMTSIATTAWELVFWDEQGVTYAAVRGPETSASTVRTLGESESFGISFAPGTSLAHLPLTGIVDGEVSIPHVGRSAFVLGGGEWEIPTYDNAEQLVEKLVQAGMLRRDQLVEEVVFGGIATVGSRTVQRRVVAGTGLTRSVIRQIERTRAAAVLLQQGALPLDVVHELGFYDQPHLARSLRRFIGRTASQLQAPASTSGPMSLLYKTGLDIAS